MEEFSMNHQSNVTRRSFLLRSGALGTGLAFSGWFGTVQGKTVEENSPDIGPVEDLMREHGILRRLILIYEEGVRRIEAKQDLPRLLLNRAGEIILHFIEEYHERLEEKYLFPRFKRAIKLVDLTEVLQKQHLKGQLLTAGILKSPDREKSVTLVREFIRMYRPHAAREDTVLFPAFHQIVGEKEFQTLGDQFEDIEQEQFGKKGFEKVVEKVAAIEKEIGIYDLSLFTPSI
jgi:hemerythrin-like domain-containing protein